MLASEPARPQDLLSTTPDCDFKCLQCAYERIRGLKNLCRYKCLAMYAPEWGSGGREFKSRRPDQLPAVTHHFPILAIALHGDGLRRYPPNPCPLLILCLFSDGLVPPDFPPLLAPTRQQANGVPASTVDEQHPRHCPRSPLTRRPRPELVAWSQPMATKSPGTPRTEFAVATPDPLQTLCVSFSGGRRRDRLLQGQLL